MDKSWIQGKTEYTWEDLLHIVSDLCDPEEGCPWDRVQTHESLINCMIEEAYEAVHAIRQNDMENLREELGDVLLQVVIHSQLASAEGAFTMEDVIQELCEKLIRRHPHVYGGRTAESAEDALLSWNERKAKECKNGLERGKNELERVPESLPALMRSQKVLRKAEECGLDDRDTAEIASALSDHMEKLLAFSGDPDAAQGADFAETNADFCRISGETLLLMADFLRKMGINAEKSLTTETEKYITKTSERA